MRQRPLAVAFLVTAVALAAQWTLVHFAYGGNWSALFYAGALYPAPPPELEAENLHRFPGTHGYDGQIYHAIAHDPLMARGPSPYVDAPRLRYRRVLVPLLAWLAAGGRAGGVDVAYRAVVLVFVFLGTCWSARLVERLGASPAWGAAFVLLPASVVSLERMTVDVALAALVAGWALTAARGSRWQWLALGAAPLVRETGVVLIAAAIVAALVERRPRHAALGAASALPALAWFAYVHARTPPFDYANSFVPLGGIVIALRALRPTLLQALDALALAGIVLAFALAARWIRASPRGAAACAAALFAALGVITQRPDNWAHAYDYGRVYTPLLLLLALEGAARRDWRWALPWALVAPRVLAQLKGPATAAVRGALGG